MNPKIWLTTRVCQIKTELPKIALVPGPAVLCFYFNSMQSVPWNRLTSEKAEQARVEERNGEWEAAAI